MPPERFHFKDLEISLHPSVYNPAEDTFLLLATIMPVGSENVLELGTGSGIIALYCASKGCLVTCTDINPYALDLTCKNIQANRHLLKGKIKTLLGDLYQPIKGNERFDLIIFNPPYLPTKQEEKTDDHWFDKALDGGPSGLSITKKFLKELSIYLKPDGSAYFVYSSLSDQHLLYSYFNTYHLHYEICKKQHFDDEELVIYRVFLP
jgi:release factor glutamine methyltransferase